MTLPFTPRFNKLFKRQKGQIIRTPRKIVHSMLSFGQFALISKEFGYLQPKHFILLEQLAKKRLKKTAKFWICAPSASLPVTKKSQGVRQGKGKGPFSHWVSKISPATVIFAVDKMPPQEAQQFLRHLSKKLPLACTIVANKRQLVSSDVSLSEQILP